MALAKVPGLVLMGYAGRQGIPGLLALANTTLDAANEACHMIGRIVTEDGATHTLDTTGSSSIGWRNSSNTFANAGTTVKVGLATVNTSTGPAARATNVADVVTYSVSKSLTGGGGGIAANTWQEHVPDTGSLSVANGDLLAMVVQMTARGGADSVTVATNGVFQTPSRPCVTDFTGGSYAVASRVPNAIITFSDGAYGWFEGASVTSVASTNQNFSNTGTREYGNFIQFPFPVTAYGISGTITPSNDFDLVLYSDPLGTPAALATVSVDTNAVGTSSSSLITEPFASAVNLSANTPYAVIAKPTTASNITLTYKTFNAAAHQKTDTLGTNCYAINRATGAFAAQNSNKDRFALGLLVGAFDNGTEGVVKMAGNGGGFVG